jgi:hypothetical protein
MKSLETIAQFGRDHGAGLAHALGFRRAKTPTESALSDIFLRLDIDAYRDRRRQGRGGIRPALLSGGAASGYDREQPLM